MTKECPQNTYLSFVCNECDLRGVVAAKEYIEFIDSGSIVIERTCPFCNGKLLPLEGSSGKYIRNSEGLMDRVGDRTVTEIQEPVTWTGDVQVAGHLFLCSQLPFICESCGISGIVEMSEDICEFYATGISIGNPCPSCNGILRAPGGRYKRNKTGLMVRISDPLPAKKIYIEWFGIVIPSSTAS